MSLVLQCDRAIKENLLYEQYDVEEFVTTKFSSNTNLSLKEIVYAQVYENYQYIREISEDIDEKLTIVESRDSSSNPKPLYIDENVKLRAGSETTISLCKPIMIKPGIKYEIQLELNMDFLCCAIATYRSSEVEIVPGITIEFHDEPTENGDIVGIVCGLRFTKS